MTVRSKSSLPQRHRVLVAGHEFILAKAAGNRALWHVLSMDGELLTLEGRRTYEGALYDARAIAADRNVEVPA